MHKIGKIQREAINGNLEFPSAGEGKTASYKGHIIVFGDKRMRRPFKVDGHSFSNLIRALRFIDKQEAMENGD